MDEVKVEYSGFWKRTGALIIDVIVVSILVFPFVFAAAFFNPGSVVVEVPFGLFTNEAVLEKSERIIDNADGSTSIVEAEKVKENVLGIWENYYEVVTVKSNMEEEFNRRLIDPQSGLPMDTTTSGDIEFIVLFIYWILLESSVLQGSVGKRLLGIKVITEKGEAPTLLEALTRNILKLLSGIILFIGFIMAGTTRKKQALHDQLSRMLVVNT